VEEVGAVATLALRVGTQRGEHRALADTRHDLGLRGRSPMGRQYNLDVDHIVGHRTADELRGDPLERPPTCALRCLDRGSDPAAAVEETKGCRKVCTNVEPILPGAS